MRTFRRLLKGPVGQAITIVLIAANGWAFSGPQNYLEVLEAQQKREAEIREIAKKMNVDPDFLLNPGGRRSFDWKSVFGSLAATLGITDANANASAQPLDVRQSISRVKSGYALVAADTTVARIAELVQISLASDAVRGKKKGQIKAELQSVLRLVDKDFLPPLRDGLPGVANGRDAKARAGVNDLRRVVKSVINAPHALDDANIDATLAQLRAAVSGSLTVRNAKPRWTKDPFPVKDTYKSAPKKQLTQRYDGAALVATPSVITAATTTAAASATASARMTSNAVSSEVTALAATLVTPAKIFAWVHDNVDWESYSGVAKGARGTLAERKGNDWDQALLLRDLLAAQGYQSQLEWGTVSLPIARAMNLAGTEDPLQAANLLATAGFDGVALTANNTPIAVQMTHAWVRAFIPYVPNRGARTGTPDTWVRMDPSFKRYDYDAGIAINGRVAWSEDEYLRTSTVRPPTDFYGDKIWSYIRANNLNCQNLSQVAKNGRIHAENFPFVPSTLTARIEAQGGVAADPPSTQVQRVSLVLTDANNAPVATYDSAIADLWGRKLTLTFAPATPDDAAIINSYGGLFRTPAYLVSLRPVFSIDDVAVAQGAAVPAGADLDLNLTFRQPNVADDTTHHEVVAGETHSEVFDAGTTPDALITARINRLKQLTASNASEDAILSEQLYLVGIRYMQHVDDGLNFAMGVRWQRGVKRVFEGAVRRQVNVSYNLGGAPLRLTPAENNIDVSRLLVGVVPINNDQSNKAEALQLAGLESSYREAAIWEEMQSRQGISAAKALLLARIAGQQLYTVNSGNVDSVLNSVSLSSDVEAEIRGSVAQGRIAKIASAPITLGHWSGTGYILEDPQTGAATFPISGGSAGGGTTGLTAGIVQEVLGSETWLAGTSLGKFLSAVFSHEDTPTTVQSDPVNMSSGNMYRFANDFTIFGRGLPVGITRTYNSRSTVNGPFGYGWTFNYGEQLIPNADGSVLYRESDGSEHLIALTAGVFVVPAGKHFALTAESSGYDLRLADGSHHRFAANGLLRSQTDMNGNSVTINRDASGRPSSIVDAAGRTVLTFTFTNGKITRITDLAGRSASYGYNGDDLISFTDTVGKIWTMSYDLAHNMTSLADPAGNTQSYDYDVDDRLMHHVDAAGGEEFFHYDIAGHTSVLTNRRGGDVLVEYDDLGRAVRQADPAGNLTTAEWDASNNRTASVDSRGFRTTCEFDARGNVTKQTSADGSVVTATYDDTSRVLTSTSAAGMLTSNTYDSGGNLTAVAQTVGTVTRTASSVYDSTGQVVSSTDANGNSSTFTWSAAGAPATRTDAANQTTTMTTDALGRITAIKDAAGNETHTSYDNADRIIEQTDAHGLRTTIAYDDAGRRIAVTTPGGTTRFSYDGEGRLLTTTGPTGARTITTYNAAGDVIASADARGNTTRFDYDLSGRRTKVVDATGGVWSYAFCGSLDKFCDVTDPAGRVTHRQFDSMGRVVAVIDSLSHTSTTRYDTAGRRVAETDANGRTTAYSYDDSGKLISVTDQAGGVIRFTYDRNGNKTSQKDALGHVTTWTYDALNRVTEQSDPLGRKTKWTYTVGNNIATRTDAKGQLVRYTWDADRLNAIAYPDGSTESVTRDANGRPLTVSNPNVTYTYTYDAMNHVRSVRNERVGYLISYDYDANGNRSRMTTPQSVTSYTYDAKNRLAGISDSFFGNFAFGYDATDRRTSLQYPNGIRTNYTYDDGYRLTAMVSKNTLGAIVDGWSYQYDAVGNRTSKTDLDGKSEVYAYDAAYRLTRASYPAGTFENVSYDAAGNRVSRSDSNGTTNYTYDAADQLLTAGSTSYTYDANGNQVTKAAPNGTTTLTWDFNNRVTGITGPDGNESNKYDAAGRRMEMAGTSIENGLVRPEYDLQGNPIADSDGGNGMWTYRLYAPGLDESLAEWRRANNRTTYLHHDALNSVTAVTLTDGTLAYRQSYSAFGAMSRTTDPSGITPTRLGFTGRETSVGSLVQYRNRYYDTSTGRFASQDSFPAVDSVPPSLHRYAYAFNSPVNLTDPTGQVVPLLWAFYFLVVEWAPVLMLIFACLFAFAIGYWIGTLIRQLWGDPAMTEEEGNVINSLTSIAAIGMALLTATTPNLGGGGANAPAAEEEIEEVMGGAAGYVSPYSRGGDCVKAASDFISKFGGSNKFGPTDRVFHVAVEYEGEIFDPTIRGNLETYSQRFPNIQFQDIPINQQWFSMSQHDELLQRLPFFPGGT